MQRSDIRSQTAPVGLAQDQNTETFRWYLLWSGLSLVWSRLESRPALAFILLSFVFGSAISAVVPPLRGPDEIAHFLRIYSYARGGLLPVTEVDGRKGIFIEHELYTRLSFFKNAGERFGQNRQQGIRYGAIMQEYSRPAGTLHEQEHAAKFMPFAGTEGYNPAAYAPYVVAAAIGNLLGLDFPNLLLLMRFLGLITFTAVAAYAIKLTPTLKWAFVLIAMLPVAIYNRSVLSADGAALTYALVFTALCFGAVQRCGRVWERSLWMTLCALSKQPQIVFVVLELMVCRMTELRRRGSSLALVVVPSFVLSPLWVLAVSADVAAWRLGEAESYPREYFDPLWKLAYMWEHPLHFPLAAWTSVTVWGDRLWPELIGILGWQDVWLPPWTYFALTVNLLLVPLPKAAIFLASMINVDLPRGVLATTAITGSLLSGITSFQALLGAHWSVP